ncbi:MAG: hypothetical protein JWN03_8448 [Nocardia sp.]|uniref:hypothetical protein n=1 Tax=Nocardia sp. TaxID=1821 RepID=UPI002601A3DA|nr:hypothetical protein [Nocardia sp.]MCU1648173.1 hypothetical protein [Nocardia sp.]
MVQPTPWQARLQTPQQKGKPLVRHASRTLRHLVGASIFLPRFHAMLVQLITATGCVLLLLVLFQPWIAASGVDGKVDSNAFGTLHITTSLVSLWSSSPPHRAAISGTWGILTGLSALGGLCTILANLRTQRALGSYAVATLTAAAAIFSSATLLYLNSKSGDLKSMLGSGPALDLGTQAGLIIRWMSGNGDYPVPGLHKVSYSTARLTGWAMLAATVSILTAATSINRPLRNDLFERIRSIRYSLAPAIQSPSRLDSDITHEQDPDHPM